MEAFLASLTAIERVVVLQGGGLLPGIKGVVQLQLQGTLRAAVAPSAGACRVFVYVVAVLLRGLLRSIVQSNSNLCSLAN